MTTQEIEIRHLQQGAPGIEIMQFSEKNHFGAIPDSVRGPHRHDHYFCFFLECGSVQGMVDFQEMDIDQPALLLSCPGQVHDFRQAEQVSGWAVAFDAKYIDQSARMVIEHSLANIAIIKLDEADKEWFGQIFHLLSAAVNEDQQAQFQQQLVQALLNSLFYRTVNLFQLQENERIQAVSLRGVEIVKNFNLLVKANFQTLKKPADYASRMNITVSYLNDTVKSITGFSSTWLIRQEVLREAQRLLFYTAKSVKEIAFHLGFEDHKYFIRLFSKTIGTSPASFRKTLGRADQELSKSTTF
ncbi:AraC family transcriptional regulator [Dyadobacter chenwenxiniae]|uniref:AraC family transcriptional regulator n=1 Tax=Dyadobacter chenwenxiniae TaxID=2906456 RepID=A0A9X1PNS7_9BACT|nr:AraC family transcriptional regulator [Dyadobacter chenwenxiniae]MCF0064560.1 AraC family transcriptional regulator [Dyadobacter chenwenxiniae]UON84382.1 AraC family transcriptional regulator [Dyadobacter chenwenxiniae]